MPPEAQKLLVDMLDAGKSIIQFVEEKTLDDLANSKLLRSGVYYQFVVLGEALAQLRHIDEQITDQISESWRIVGFRNQIIHGYAKIDDEITWRIIREKLPIFIDEVEGLLAG